VSAAQSDSSVFGPLVGVGRWLREALEAIRLDPRPGGRRVPVRPVLGAEVKFFGRHRNGMIRDGVVRAIAPVA
jgi:hypothetical protein